MEFNNYVFCLQKNIWPLQRQKQVAQMDLVCAVEIIQDRIQTDVYMDPSE